VVVNLPVLWNFSAIENRQERVNLSAMKGSSMFPLTSFSIVLRQK